MKAGFLKLSQLGVGRRMFDGDLDPFVTSF